MPPDHDPAALAEALGYPNDRTFVWPYAADPEMPLPPSVEAEMTPPDELTIERGMAVLATDGAVGRVMSS